MKLETVVGLTLRAADRLTRRAAPPLAAAILVTCWLEPCMAVSTSKWRLGGILDFGRCESVNVAVAADGSARLAPNRELLSDPSQAYVWSLAEGPDGVVYAGTGDDGLILAIPPAGEPSVFYDSLELQILSLAVGPDGAVYAGGSPDGVILRIQGGAATTYFDTPESYIWALGFDDSGALFAATGDQGRLYRITGPGQGELYLDSDELHLQCMVRDEDRWVIGTSPNGLVVEVVAPDSALVRFDAAEEEIKALTRAADGTLYIAAVGQRARGGNGGGGNGAPIDAGSREKNGRGANVYRMNADGAVQSLWRSSEQLVLALEPDDGGGGLWVGTGDRGALVWLDDRGTATRMFETTESQVLCLLQTDRGGLVIGTGNLAAVYRVGPDVETEGLLTSEIFDARNVAAWGRLRWQARTPPGTAIRFQTRTGNTEIPDDTWSGWSEQLRDPGGEPVPSPAARYVQWRARLLGAASSTPTLEWVSVAYLEHNLPPRLHAVDVSSAGGDLLPVDYDWSPDRVQQTLPNGVQVEFAFPSSASGPVRLDQVGWLRSARVASWVADDPNDDTLRFDLYLKAEDEREWRPLAEEIEEQIHAFQTADLEDGRYRLKVSASDRASNPEGWARADSLVSRPFMVDNTPPRIEALRAQRLPGGDLLVTGIAVDSNSPVASLAYSLDAGPWREAFPEDAIFDTFEEPFRFTVELDDSSGEISLLVRAADEAGNVASRRVVVP